MKKIYMIPSLEVTKIQTQNMIAGSPLHDAGSGDAFEQTDFTGTTEDTSGNLSRGTIWDEE